MKEDYPIHPYGGASIRDLMQREFALDRERKLREKQIRQEAKRGIGEIEDFLKDK